MPRSAQHQALTITAALGLAAAAALPAAALACSRVTWTGPDQR
ncbi:MAG: hypothetical protein ACKO3F_13115 [Cyanobium sp.]